MAEMQRHRSSSCPHEIYKWKFMCITIKGPETRITFSELIIPAYVQICAAFTSVKMMCRSVHNFAPAMTAKLSWQVPVCISHGSHLDLPASVHASQMCPQTSFEHAPSPGMACMPCRTLATDIQVPRIRIRKYMQNLQNIVCPQNIFCLLENPM